MNAFPSEEPNEGRREPTEYVGPAIPDSATLGRPKRDLPLSLSVPPRCRLKDASTANRRPPSSRGCTPQVLRPTRKDHSTKNPPPPGQSPHLRRKAPLLRSKTRSCELKLKFLLLFPRRRPTTSAFTKGPIPVIASKIRLEEFHLGTA